MNGNTPVMQYKVHVASPNWSNTRDQLSTRHIIGAKIAITLILENLCGQDATPNTTLSMIVSIMPPIITWGHTGSMKRKEKLGKVEPVVARSIPLAIIGPTLPKHTLVSVCIC